MNGTTAIPPAVIFAELLGPMLDEDLRMDTRRLCARILRVIIQFSAHSTRNRGERNIYSRLFGLTLELDRIDFHASETLSAIYQEIHVGGHTAYFLTFLDYIAGVLEHGIGDYNYYSCLLRR